VRVHPEMAMLIVALADFVAGGNFNPRNINHMPAVKIFVRLELDKNISFLDGH
jgi:hypothetical protein